jgi:hypothetical protein
MKVTAWAKSFTSRTWPHVGYEHANEPSRHEHKPNQMCEPQEQKLRRPSMSDCPSRVFSTATKIVATAKTKPRAPNMCAHPLSDAKASIDQLPWIIFDAASRTCPPMGRQDKCGVAIIWCSVSHLMRRKTKDRAPRQLQAGSCDDGLDSLGNNRRHPRRDDMLSRSR